MLSVYMVTLETLTELCTLVFTFLCHLLALNLGSLALASFHQYNIAEVALRRNHTPCLRPLSWEGARAILVENHMEDFLVSMQVHIL